MPRSRSGARADPHRPPTRDRVALDGESDARPLRERGGLTGQLVGDLDVGDRHAHGAALGHERDGAGDLAREPFVGRILPLDRQWDQVWAVHHLNVVPHPARRRRPRVSSRPGWLSITFRSSYSRGVSSTGRPATVTARLPTSTTTGPSEIVPLSSAAGPAARRRSAATRARSSAMPKG